MSVVAQALFKCAIAEGSADVDLDAHWHLETVTLKSDHTLCILAPTRSRSSRRGPIPVGTGSTGSYRLPALVPTWGNRFVLVEQ